MCQCCALTARPSGIADCLDGEATTANPHGHDHGHDHGGGADGGVVASTDAPKVVTDYTALLSDHYWNWELGQSAFVTYSFETALDEDPDYSDAFEATFREFDATRKAVAREAFDKWADVSGLVFIEVAVGQGDIELSTVDIELSPGGGDWAGYAYFAYRQLDYGAYDGAIGGDIFIDDDFAPRLSLADTILHEIGHAVGLEHPFSGDAVLADGLDHTGNTVMSYTSMGSRFATTLGRFDLQAVRHVYGTSDGAHLSSWDWDEASATLTQVGKGGADKIAGTSVSDVIMGGAGDDRIAGFRGDDRLHGGAGDDTMYGGEGDDVLYALAGDDTLRGGKGDDVYHIDSLDRYDYPTGTYTGGDSILEYAGEGTDTIVAYASLKLDVGVENGIAIGAVDLIGTYKDNVLTGSGHANRLDGSSGDDRLDGRGGDDVLIGGYGADLLDGGAGFDTVEMSSSGALDLRDPGRSTGDASGDRHVSIERVVGTAGQDAIRGKWNAETLEGMDGGDRLVGRGGDDTLSGGAGNDALTGGAGADVLDGGTGTDAARYDWDGRVRVDLVDPTANTGAARGDTFADIENLVGSRGHDVLLGDGAANAIWGGAGADWLIGRDGNDVLDGGAGKDILVGGAGGDALRGGAGDDRIVGGAGADRLTGGAGDDVFVVHGAGESALGVADWILDFQLGGDRLDLTAIDGDAGIAGNQALGVVDAFTGTGGEVLARAGLVLVDANGDGTADMAVGIAGGLTLDETDFIL